jgi:hypothetical protein
VDLYIHSPYQIILVFSLILYEGCVYIHELHLTHTSRVIFMKPDIFVFVVYKQNYDLTGSRDSSISIATGYGLDDQEGCEFKFR